MSLSHSLADVGRALAYYPKLSKFFGSINSSIFFTQLYYWQSRVDDEKGVYKSSEEWTDETGLSYREQATARSNLVKLGFLKETHKRLQHRIYFRLDLEALDAAFEAWTKTQFPNDENAIGEMRKAQLAENENRTSPGAENADGGATKTHSVNKVKITAKSTTETTAKSYTAPRRKRREADPAGDDAAPAAPMVVTGRNGVVHEIPGELRYPGEGTRSHRTWIAYAIAYHGRYNSWPIWNRTVGGQIANLIERIGIELAPLVAVHFVRRVNEEFVVKQMHPVKLLLSDAEKWATQCQTGTTITNTRAKQIDQSQSNYDAAAEAVAIVRAKRAEREARGAAA